MRIFKWLKKNVLFVFVLLLLAISPLYPKLPLIGVQRTWVYVRLEDFILVGVLFIWALFVFFKKTSFKTPLTIPIAIFWIVGAISTAYAIVFIFPNLENLFPHIALLNYLRRIEYLSVFFLAFSAINNKKLIKPIAITLAIVLILVVAYGLGQKGYIVGWDNRFPAFSTMNEEFAKGIPLKLSALGRVQSTFAGHYDLAAYLVLMIPLVASMIFGFRNIFMKLFLFGASLGGLILLLMTASRTSFAVYLLTIIFMLVIQKQKKFIIPVVIGSILLLNSFQGISQRFASTLSTGDIVVDARTGKVIGMAKEVSPTPEITKTPIETKKPQEVKKVEVTKPVEKPKQTKEASQPSVAPIVIEEIESTGENLPQGSGYINLPSEPATQSITQVTYKRSKLKEGTVSAQISSIQGDFIIKKALAYDVSFTTRFQGEWPRAIDAFKRNVLLGSGYSSISLATDNNYLRILGEVGSLGFISFFLILLFFGIYIYRILPYVDSPLHKSFILGVVSGLFALFINATLIDVFEASKIAYVMWLLIGIVVGLLHLYQKTKINFWIELRNVFISKIAIIVYLAVAVFAIFYVTFNNYFVGDDFTWLRWAADCKKVLYTSGLTKCEPIKNILMGYFTDANGFFYRPLMKVYFFWMYAFFWLNPFIYHIISVLSHAICSALVFLIGLKLLKNKLFALLAALFFIVLSIHAETAFWISSVGHLFATVTILLSILFYQYWNERKSVVFLFLTFILAALSPFFHEFGIVAPLLILGFDLIQKGKIVMSKEFFLKSWFNIAFLLIIPVYLLARYHANSHWLSGDYSYRLSLLPFNIIGNLLGYLAISFVGYNALAPYEAARALLRQNILVAILVSPLALIGGTVLLYKIKNKITFTDKKVILQIIALIIFPLLIYVGLGNITARYVYLASAGFMILFSFGLKYLHGLVSGFNKGLGVALILIISFGFSLFHLSQLLKVNQDWQKAGEITNKFLMSFKQTYYVTTTTLQNPVYYFVNVPIKTGEAWVFPVGLDDALWFTFQNKNLTVRTAKTLDLALDEAEGSTSAKVFEFNQYGNVEEVTRTKNTITVPIK